MRKKTQCIPFGSCEGATGKDNIRGEGERKKTEKENVRDKWGGGGKRLSIIRDTV